MSLGGEPSRAGIDSYVRVRQIALAQSVLNRCKIYLDLRFWILLRDAAAGATASSDCIALLSRLQEGVRDGSLICPISESTFIELMKQANTSTRRKAIAQLIDELSLGVSLVSGRMRIATEIAHFLYGTTSAQKLHEMQELIWTKLSYALGYMHPSVPEFDTNTMLAVRRGVFDRMWNASATEIVAAIGDQWSRHDITLLRSAQKINADIKRHADEVVSYQAAYHTEIAGALDASRDLIANVVAGMAVKAGVPPPTELRLEESAIKFMNALRASFKRPSTRGALRTIHAFASLHAGLRYDKQTNFSAGHYFDFEHAAAAMAYCDAFFTERFLSHLCNTRHVNLSALNNCRATADASEALQVLCAFGSAIGGSK